MNVLLVNELSHPDEGAIVFFLVRPPKGRLRMYAREIDCAHKEISHSVGRDCECKCQRSDQWDKIRLR